MNRLISNTRRFNTAGISFSVLPVVTKWGKEEPQLIMEESWEDKNHFFQYLNEEIERELVAYPSADRCTVMKIVRLVTKEILHSILWGPRQESTPFPENPDSASKSDLEVFARAWFQALVRAEADLDKR